MNKSNMQENSNGYTFLGFFRWIFGGCAAAAFALFLLLVGNSGVLNQQEVDPQISSAIFLSLLSSILLVTAVAMGKYNEKEDEHKGSLMHELTGTIGLFVLCIAIFLVIKYLSENQKYLEPISFKIIISSLFIFIPPAILFAANGMLIDHKKKKKKSHLYGKLRKTSKKTLFERVYTKIKWFYRSITYK